MSYITAPSGHGEFPIHNLGHMMTLRRVAPTLGKHRGGTIQDLT